MVACRAFHDDIETQIRKKTLKEACGKSRILVEEKCENKEDICRILLMFQEYQDLLAPYFTNSELNKLK